MSEALVDSDVVAVVGAGGNVGRLVTQRLCELDRFYVRAVLRDADSPAAASFSSHERCEVFEADTRDYRALSAALAGANAVICTTGVPAFDISGQWRDGNHPASVDHFGVKNAVYAFAATEVMGSARVAKKRFVLMSSIGVCRRGSLPYSILNAAGVLEAKWRGEEALRDMAKKYDFASAVVRPGQLFGGPYDNNRYLGTLFELDKKESSSAVKITPGDSGVGDTVRSALAGVLLRCVLASTMPRHMDFGITNEDGEAPSEEAVDELLRDNTLALDPSSSDSVDEQLARRLDLGLESVGQALGNATSKILGRED